MGSSCGQPTFSDAVTHSFEVAALRHLPCSTGESHQKHQQRGISTGTCVAVGISALHSQLGSDSDSHCFQHVVVSTDPNGCLLLHQPVTESSFTEEAASYSK